MKNEIKNTAGPVEITDRAEYVKVIEESMKAISNIRKSLDNVTCVKDPHSLEDGFEERSKENKEEASTHLVDCMCELSYIIGLYHQLESQNKYI